MPDDIEALLAAARRLQGLYRPQTGTDEVLDHMVALANALSAARAVIEEAKAVLTRVTISPTVLHDRLDAILSKFPSGEERR